MLFTLLRHLMTSLPVAHRFLQCLSVCPVFQYSNFNMPHTLGANLSRGSYLSRDLNPKRSWWNYFNDWCYLYNINTWNEDVGKGSSRSVKWSGNVRPVVIGQTNGMRYRDKMGWFWNDMIGWDNMGWLEKWWNDSWLSSQNGEHYELG